MKTSKKGQKTSKNDEFYTQLSDIEKELKHYKEHFKNKKLSDAEWIKAMVKFPKLIERPIIIHNNKAVIARPIENIDDLF